MKRICLLLVLLVNSLIKAQTPTIRQYLQGIWEMECCDTDYWIYNNNEIYWVNNTNASSSLSPAMMFSIPQIPVYNYDSLFNKVYKDKIHLDSVDFDRPFNLDETEMEVLYIFYYENNDIIQNKWLKVLGNRSYLNYDYYITPKELNSFYVWDGGSPSSIIYYNRVLKPPKFVLDYYKDIASDKFKKVKSSGVYLFQTKGRNSIIAYLKKGEEVEIIMESNGWLKIRRYYATPSEGWIRKEDVE